MLFEDSVSYRVYTIDKMKVFFNRNKKSNYILFKKKFLISQTEQRRHREWACRLERERQLQLENCDIKQQAAELDNTSLREEIARIREQLETARTDKAQLENDLREARREADAARESERHAISRANEAHHMLDVMREELSLRNEDQQRLEELVQQVVQLQARNKSTFTTELLIRYCELSEIVRSLSISIMKKTAFRAYLIDSSKINFVL